LIARLLCIVVLSLATFAQVAPPAKSSADFRMAGVVVDSITNQPLTGVKVFIYVSESPEISRHMDTGADGRFAFTGLPAGKYTLVGSALGYRAQGPHQRGDYLIGIAVGPNLDSESIVFRLVSDARVDGTVTDDDGEPVRNGNVALYQRTHDIGRQQTAQVGNAVTDDRGHYLFSHLAPGTYFVAVSARPWYAQYPNPGEPAPDADSAARIAEERAPLEAAYPMTFYPSAEESSGATPIVLQAGDRFTADVAMRAVPAVHLRVRTGNAARKTSGNGFPRVSQRIFEGALVPVMSSQGYTASTGVYEYTGIAPGHYVIEMPDASGKGRVGWYKEMDLAGTVELDAAENPPLASVTGALAFEGAERPSGKVYVVLANRASTETFAAEVTPKGTFDFSEMEVRPGTYDVLLNVAQGFQLRALQARGGRVSGQTLLISGGSVQLALTATRELAHITGMVVHDDRAYPGAMVLLVPANPASNLTLFRRDQSDSDGTFNLREVLAGTYTVIALENGWDLDWANAATLQPFLKNGTPVEVSGQNRLNIKVQLQP
jgi:Carboxypeptidase regulatory-like domain